jgi:beta-glucosidase
MKNKTKTKKPISLVKAIVIPAVSLIIAIVLIVGNVFAEMYSGLITTFFSSSDYQVTDAEKELCEQVAAEGIVLLKNEENALPLGTNEKKVAFLGQDSVDFVYGGAGSGSVDTTSAPTIKQSFERAGFTIDETVWNFYVNGAGKDYRKDVPTAQGSGSFFVNEVPASKYTDEMKNSLKSDDVIVCVVGRSGGESSDLPLTKTAKGYNSDGNYYYLQVDGNERDMIKLACSTGKKVILIVNANNPMELGFLEEEEYANVKAALWVGGVGQEGLYAVGEIFSGKVNPSGRLTDTYAYDSHSAPSNANLGKYSIDNADQVTNYSDKADSYIVYAEGIYVGYKYYETRYEDYVLSQGNAGEYDYSTTVQYPFGYGQSYTQFSWTDFTMAENASSFEFSVKVTNKGDYAGKDVVELYMQSPYTKYDKDNNVEKSAIELVGYAKTDLLAVNGEQTVTISIDKEMMKAYDYTKAKTYIVDDGIYYFTAATDAHVALNNVLLKKGTDTSKLFGSGNADLVAEYTQANFDGTTYSVSQEDSTYTITNQFESADVNYYEANTLTYLTRKDWVGTFPTTYKNGSWTASEQMISDLNWNRSDEVVNDSTAVMPTNSSGTTYTVQDAIGKNYDDPIWDQLVNQLSADKMIELVRLGGYGTIALKAIGLPATIDKDGPSGISGTLVGGTSCMAWPVETMMAATWNDSLMEEMGKLIGEDSINSNTAGWYAPAADIHRSPYSGRNFEYYSEDGVLSGKIGAAEMRGVRSMGVIAFMKHFALNDQETNRSGGAYFANEQAMREVYLRGFEYIVREGGATAAMTAMNRIGTTWAGAHKGLMTEVLRNEWGFRGVTITDQASVPAMFYQDIISGLWAGNDLWLNTSGAYWKLNDYYAGATTNATIMANVHKAAKNIIYAVVNSNAVQTYGGMKTEEQTGMPLWQIFLIIADVVIFAACLVGIVLPLTLYLLQRRKANKENAIKLEDPQK